MPVLFTRQLIAGFLFLVAQGSYAAVVRASWLTQLVEKPDQIDPNKPAKID
jgi:hypothetical protein